MSELKSEITPVDSRSATPDYEGDYQKINNGEASVENFDISHLFEMANQPFATKDGYAIKNRIFFELIRNHPQVSPEDLLIVDCRDGDLQRRNAKDKTDIGKAINFLKGVNGRISKDTPIDTVAAIKQAFTQAYYHNKQIKEAADLQQEFCNDPRFKELPPFRRAMMLESLASFYLDLDDTDGAALTVHDMHGCLVDKNLKESEVPRVVGGFNHISGDLEYKRGRYSLAAESYYAVHATFSPDSRNQIVGAMKFMHCKWLENRIDDPRFESVRKFFLDNYSKLEETDKIGHAASWEFVSQKFDIKG
ncbi:MAG: hypothetical protein WC659_00390 [Patescibacteria group bacterium]